MDMFGVLVLIAFRVVVGAQSVLLVWASEYVGRILNSCLFVNSHQLGPNG